MALEWLRSFHPRLLCNAKGYCDCGFRYKLYGNIVLDAVGYIASLGGTFVNVFGVYCIVSAVVGNNVGHAKSYGGI